MGAITSFCGVRFDTMADYVRHLPRCVICMSAHSRRKPLP